MALPAGVNLATVTTGVFATLESGQNLGVTITAKASQTDLVWSTDGLVGQPYLSQPFTNNAGVGNEVSMQLLPTDLPHWYYNGEPVDVSNGNQAFVWQISAQAWLPDTQNRPQPVGDPITWVNVVLPSNGGVPGTFDLDLMATNTFAGNVLITIPITAWVLNLLADAENAAANSSNFANNAANSATAAGASAMTASGAATDAQANANAAHNFANDAANANANAWNAANGVGANLDPILANVLYSANSLSYAAEFGGSNIAFTYYGNGLVNVVTEKDSGGTTLRTTRMNYFGNGLVQNTVEVVPGKNTATTTFTWASNTVTAMNRVVT